MKQITFLLPFLFLFSCKSPSELLESGNHNAAFRKAVSEYKKGKNLTENLNVIRTATKIKVDEALLYTDIMSQSNKVSSWIKTQKKVYTLLKDIGEANIVLKGDLNKPYDMLCNNKKELDFQIVEFFYDEGHDHLDRFYHDGNKVDARHAYQSFVDCEKYEGERFFLNLLEDKEDAYQNGIVYYVSNYGYLGKSHFLKPLPRDAEFQPDCDVAVSHGFVSFSKTENSSDQNYSKEIESGTEAVTDTSGKTTYITLYETVNATVTTKTIEVTATVYTDIRVHNITGQCSMRSSSYSTSITDSYKEVQISGDQDALDHHVDETNGEPISFRNDLEKDLLYKADQDVGL